MSIIENTKEIAELVKKLGDIDLYKRIVELEGEIIELSRQKWQLAQKVDELEKKTALKAAMRFQQPLYFQDSDAVPFCPTCYETGERAIHLLDYGVFNSPQKGPLIHWYCTVCKGDFYVPRNIR
jgi:hypothetical protein